MNDTIKIGRRTGKLALTTKRFQYYIFSDGTLYRCRIKTGELMPYTPNEQGSGYKVVNFYDDERGCSHTVYVHRMVAEAFLDKPDGKDFVDHKDSDRGNNDVSNLRWVDRKTNNSTPHARRMKSENASHCAPRHCKVMIQFPDGCRRVFDTVKQAAATIGCTKNFVYIVLKRQRGMTKRFLAKWLDGGAAV